MEFSTKQARQRNAKLRLERKLAESSQRLEQMTALFSLSQSVKLGSVLDELLHQVRQLVPCDGCSVLLAERGVLRARAERGETPLHQVRLGDGVVGLAAAQGRMLVCDRETCPEAFGDTELQELLCVPMRLRGQTVGCMCLFTHDERTYTTRDVDLLHAMACQGAVTLENARLYEERDRVTELLQTTLIPGELSHPGVEVAHRHFASKTLSGDYYDLFPAGDKLVVAIADVAGKGPEAGIHTVPVKFVIRAHALLGAGPGEILTRLNQLLELSPQSRTVTVFCGVLDLAARTLRYARAGHEPPLLWNGSRVEALEADGMLLGALPGASFEEREVDCPEGSCLLLYTDGLTEARATWGGSFFGLAPVRRVLEDHARQGPASVVDRIVVEVSRFTRDMYSDDLSILALRF